MSESIIQSSQEPEALMNRGMQSLLQRWRKTLDSGFKRVGWKMASLATKVDHLQLQPSAPIIGFLTSDHLLTSGCVYPLKEETILMVEAEIGLVLGCDVLPGRDNESARLAIEALSPALEIINVTRSLNKIEEILEGNLFHEAVIFGDAQASFRNLSPKQISARVLKNGVEERTGDHTRIANDLGELIRLIADGLDHYGECLRKGDRIISGSMTQPVPVQPGDDIVVEIEPLGQISVHFVAA